MTLVDTSAWIEWLARTPTGLIVATHVPRRRDWLVPTVVQFELAKWLLREFGEDTAHDVIASTEMMVVVELDSQIAYAAAERSVRQKLSIADAIIYETAQFHGARLLTCDAHFAGLADVIHVPKVG